MTTQQVDFWRSDFGDDYAQRNAITPELHRRSTRDWGRILTHAVSPKPNSVLEVGCNVGRNLLALSNFIPELHGIEPNAQACATLRQQPGLSSVTLHQGIGQSLPYADASIDLVFTSGVLIHVAPEDLGNVVDEIVRVARHYVVCVEYFAHSPEQVPYRGHEGYLFKRDFGSFYLDRHPDLRVLDYGFLWQRFDSCDNSNWWLFGKR